MTNGSGNVFIDLGFSAAAALNLRLRSQMMTALRTFIETEGLTQAAAAERLQVPQTRILDLIQGKLSRFTLDALVIMLAEVGLDVDILGAHEKLTTCALIELTTSKTGFATRHASERIESIRAAFWRSLPMPGYPARAWGFPPRASRVPWLGGLSLSPFVCFPTRFSSFLAQARNSFLPHPARQSRVAAEPETRGTNERLVVNFW